MKTLLFLLLTVCTTLSQGLTLRSPLRDIKPAPVSGITTTYWLDLEFGSDGDRPNPLQLEASHAPWTNDWTAYGATNQFYIRTAAQKAFTSVINGTTDSGSRGLEMDLNSGATAAKGWYLKIDNGANATSFAFWYKASSLAASIGLVLAEPSVQIINSGGSVQSRVIIGTDISSNPLVAMYTSSAGNTITLAADTWYRFECLSQRSGTCSLEVFNEAGTPQGTSSGTGTAQDGYYFIIGGFNDWMDYGSIYLDNIIINISGTTPLGP